MNRRIELFLHSCFALVGLVIAFQMGTLPSTSALAQGKTDTPPTTSPVPGVPATSGADELKAKVAAAKQAAAANQVALKQYTWTERTTLSLKGEVKSTKNMKVTHGADGKLVKTPVAAGEEPDTKKKRGVRGKIVENKVEEYKEYMQQVRALIKDYVPPSPKAMQAAFEAGRASVSKSGPDGVSIVFSDYAHPGDKMTLTMNSGTKKISKLDVSSALENKDPVTLGVLFKNLDDGTSYPGVSTIDVPAKSIQVKVEQLDHRKATT